MDRLEQLRELLQKYRDEREETFRISFPHDEMLRRDFAREVNSIKSIRDILDLLENQRGITDSNFYACQG